VHWGPNGPTPEGPTIEGPIWAQPHGVVVVFSICVLDGLISRTTYDVIDEATTFTYYYMSCFVGSGSSFVVLRRPRQQL
jgi:hypothetical protein